MAQQKRKELVINVDCGYSSLKIIVNNMLITTKKGNKRPIGSEVVAVTNDTEFILDKTADYIGISYMGANYLVGEYARQLLLEEKWRNEQEIQRSEQESFNRFSSNQFEVSLIAGIAYAIVQYCEYTQKMKRQGKLSDDEVISVEELCFVDIYLALALPQAIYEQRREGIVPRLIKRVYRKHEIKLDIGTESYNMDFTICNKQTKRMISSQVIAAFAGATTVEDDENGKPLSKPQIDPLKAPILIIDGGYKTVGLFRLTRGGVIQNAESNTDFSMAVIDEKIENEIAALGRSDIKAYNIEMLCGKADERVIKVERDGKFEDYDLVEAREKYAREYCNELIMYLNNKFNNFKDVKQILITGGTGAMYYEQLKEYIENNTSMNGPIELAHYKMYGQDISPVYAIVAGLSKQFKEFLRAYADTSANE